METWSDVEPVFVGGVNSMADYEYRLPLVQMSAGNREKLRKTLKAVGVLK